MISQAFAWFIFAIIFSILTLYADKQTDMFQNLKVFDLIIVLLIMTVFVIAGYYYVNPLARNLLWLQTYPVRAELAVATISCSEDSPSWLTDVLTMQSRDNNAPANQIAYISPQGQLHHCENGYIGQYPLLSAAITDTTRFRYASVTKLWTADAILALIKDDRLSLDTKLSDIITEIDAPKDPNVNNITIRQLLLHRAGFNRYSVFGHDMFGIGQAICPDNLKGLNEIKLGFIPDTKTSYSNLGYCLLGEVISQLHDDMPYKEVIAQQYNFADSSLRFISNAAMPDEVSYNYVETGITGVGDIYTAFDYEGWPRLLDCQVMRSTLPIRLRPWPLNLSPIFYRWIRICPVIKANLERAMAMRCFLINPQRSLQQYFIEMAIYWGYRP